MSKIYLYLGVVVLIIIMVIIAISLSSQRQGGQPPPDNTPPPTPIPSIFIPTNRDLTPEENDILMQKQAQDDKSFGKFVGDIYQNYPWYNSLPLHTPGYFVYFDLEKKSFIGLLYPDRSSSTPIETQAETSKNEVARQLGELGINLNDYPPIQWEVK